MLLHARRYSSLPLVTCKISHVNEIPLDYVDDVPKDEFEEEEDPQEEEDDMEVDIEEDENEPELTYPYEKVDPLNPPPPTFESEPDDEIEVENPIKHEDETVPVSVYEVGESSTTAIPREDGDRLLPGFMRRDIDSLFGGMVNFSRQLCGHETPYSLVEKKGKAKDKFYGKLILDLGKVRSSVEQGTAAMEKLVEKLGNVEEKAECKKLKKELDEARLSNTFLRMQNERVERDLYWTRNHASKVSSHYDVQALWRRLIKKVFDAAIAAKRIGQAKDRLQQCLETNNRMPWTEMKQLMTAEFCSIEEIQRMEHELWNLKVKEYDIGEVTSSNPADLNEDVRMAHKLMEHKSQARNEIILEGKKRKWEILQSGNSSGKGNQRDNSRQTLQNNQKQRNARAMVTAPTDGKLPLCHVGQYTIKCHKCGKQGHTRNRCPKKGKQEEVGEVRGRDYAIKEVESKGPYVVTGTFLLNNQHASVLFDSSSDRSFVNTRFSSMLDIKPIKIEDSYEVELDDGRIASTNSVLKCCTLSLVNHVFEINLMPIELGTFDVIIGMD
ncbi:putative reverse transcriptase domain-containing protein [Tanacetum coccineum]